jgi:integrase
VGRRHPYLHKRGDRYYFFAKDKDGKRFEESLRTSDIETARKRYEERQSEIKSGCSPNERSSWMLQRASEEWLERRQFDIAKGSYHSERSIVRNLLRELGADSILRSLADIEKVRAYQHKRRKVGASPKTVNNEVQVLRGILEIAQLWQRVEREYKPLRRKKSDIPDALTLEESFHTVKRAAESPLTAVAPKAAVLGLSTGVRKGEIERFKLEDLHPRDRYPYAMVRRENTKTDAGARRVALDQCAVWAVESLIERARLLGSVSPGDYLLPADLSRHTRRSDPLHGGRGFDPHHHQTSWEWEWDEFRKLAGISHRRFHDLRHTYITRAAEAGVPPAVLQAQVGHVSTEMLRWYTHISSRAQHQAACRIEAENPQLLQALGISTIRPAVVPTAGMGVQTTNGQQLSGVNSAAFSSAGSQPPTTRGHCRLRLRGVSREQIGTVQS